MPVYSPPARSCICWTRGVGACTDHLARTLFSKVGEAHASYACKPTKALATEAASIAAATTASAGSDAVVALSRTILLVAQQTAIRPPPPSSLALAFPWLGTVTWKLHKPATITAPRTQNATRLHSLDLNHCSCQPFSSEVLCLASGMCRVWEKRRGSLLRQGFSLISLMVSRVLIRQRCLHIHIIMCKYRYMRIIMLH